MVEWQPHTSDPPRPMRSQRSSPEATPRPSSSASSAADPVASANPTSAELVAGIVGWIVVGLVSTSILISAFARASVIVLVGAVVLFLVLFQLLRFLPGHSGGVQPPNTDPPDVLP